MTVVAKLKSFFGRMATYRPPDIRIKGVTGDARFTYVGKNGVGMANRIDTVDLDALDRARFHPIVRDALAVKHAALTSGDFHFVCTDPRIAAFAAELAHRPVRDLISILVKGGQSFGRQSCEVRYPPKLDVRTPAGQGDEGKDGYHADILWGLEFGSFDPRHTRVLIDAHGRPQGIRQFMIRDGKPQDVMFPYALNYAHGQEFDGVYGVSDVKAAVPYIEAAISLTQAMVSNGELMANPYKVIRYPEGVSNYNGSDVPNADIAMQVGQALEGGSTVALPSDPYTSMGEATSALKWDVKYDMIPSASDIYVPRLDWFNSMIRLALAGIPQMASGGDSPDSGTYGLGEIQIRLFLQNLQNVLDAIDRCIEEQVLNHWVRFNFGPRAPKLRIQRPPLDMATGRMILSSLLQQMGTGQPIQNAEGDLVYLDLGRVTADAGLPIVVKPKPAGEGGLADRIRQKLAERMGEAPATSDETVLDFAPEKDGPDGL